MQRHIVLALLLCAATSEGSNDVSGGLTHPATVHAWTEQDVHDWLARVGLARYVAQAKSSSVTGRSIADGGSVQLVQDLNITNPVHQKKVAAHVTALLGDCPCNVPGATSVMRMLSVYRKEIFMYAFALSESPRIFFLCWHFMSDRSWESLVKAQGGEVFTSAHRPANYTLGGHYGERAQEEDSTGFITMILAYVFPYGALLYATIPFLWSNTIIVLLQWIVLIVSQLSEVNEVFTLVGAMHSTPSPSALLTKLASSVGTALAFNSGIILTVILVTYLLATYVLPNWLQLTIIAAYFTLQLLLTGVRILSFVGEVMEEPPATEQKTD